MTSATERKERGRFEKSPEREVLEAFFKTQPPGAELSWIEIEAVTGVPLSQTFEGMQHRAIARTACIAAGHAGGWVPVPGWGIKLASPENIEQIAARRSRKFMGQFKRSVRECEGALALDLDPIQRQAVLWRRDAHKIALQSQRSDLGALPSPPSRMEQKPMLPQAKSKAKDA